jgi:hypothetical protein
MKETILRALYLPLLLIILVQPMLAYVDYLLENIVKSNTSYITQKAAVDGVVTPSLRQEVVDNLTAVGFSSADINIEYSNSIKDRKQRIDVILKTPRLIRFPFNFATVPENQNYYGHGYIMSEFLD